MRNLKAFTILELVVVMGILVAISILVLPVTITQVNATNLESTSQEIASSLYTFQQNAYSGRDGKDYGIKFNTTDYELFIGSSYASAEASDTETLTSGLQISDINLTGGADEIVFTSGGFRPSASGTISVSDGITTYIVSVNSEGFIEYLTN